MASDLEPAMLLEVELVQKTLSARFVPPPSKVGEVLRPVILGSREVDLALIAGLVKDLGYLVHHAMRWGDDGDRGSRELLRRKGAALFDALLPQAIKSVLRSRSGGALEILCDREPAIPWELLHSGHGFLGLDFALGVGGGGGNRARDEAYRGLAKRMLVVADPRGDLIGSYYEGLTLRDEISARAPLSVDLRASDVSRGDVMELLRDYDIVHYAGHAEPDPVDGARGWLLRDGALTAAQVAELAGGARFPRLVFVNACRSAKRDPEVGEQASLATAFIEAGARHVIGARWDVPDEPASGFALAFYAALTQGQTIGEAARRARLAIAERYGEGSVYWANWTLMGPPDETLVAARPRASARAARGEAQAALGPLAARVRGEAVSAAPVPVTTLEANEPTWVRIGRWVSAGAVLATLLGLAAGLHRARESGIDQSPVPTADFGPVERIEPAPREGSQAPEDLVIDLVGDPELAPGERFALRWGTEREGFLNVWRIGSDGDVAMLLSGLVRAGESAVVTGVSGDAMGTERFVVAWRAVAPEEPRSFAAELLAETDAMAEGADVGGIDLEVVRTRVVELLEDRFDRVRVLDVAHR